MPEELLDLKCDLRAVTKEMKNPFTTEVNRRDSLQYITTEFHVVPTSSPYRIRLDEVPDKDSGLTIPGWAESLSLPTQAGQFYVDWVLGYVYFHSSDANKVVQPLYFGKGSLIDAADLNIITRELGYARDITNSLRPSAQDTPNTSIRIEPGIFYIGDTQVNYLGNSNIRMGAGGEFEPETLNPNYYNKILFSIDSTGLLKKYEGTQGQTADTAIAPSLPTGEMPVCLITVQDDGTGQPGTIKPIESSNITDFRPFLKVASREHRYLTVYLEGLPTLGEIFFDGFYFGESVTIDQISLFARTAPKGSDLQIDIMKNGSVLGRVATLGQDRQYQFTEITPVSFTPVDKLGLKVVAVDGQGEAGDLTVLLHYF